MKAAAGHLRRYVFLFIRYLLQPRCATRGLWSIAGRTSDPQTALANLLARDALYTEEVKRQAAALQLPTIEVNGTATVDELVERAAHCLGIRR